MASEGRRGNGLPAEILGAHMFEMWLCVYVSYESLGGYFVSGVVNIFSLGIEYHIIFFSISHKEIH